MLLRQKSEPRFLINSGKKNYALQVIEEGLTIDPGNMELLNLKASLAKK